MPFEITCRNALSSGALSRLGFVKDGPRPPPPVWPWHKAHWDSKIFLPDGKSGWAHAAAANTSAIGIRSIKSKRLHRKPMNHTSGPRERRFGIPYTEKTTAHQPQIRSAARSAGGQRRRPILHSELLPGYPSFFL